jgi:predicted anti-sigma-YlaC factor YlaD
MENRFEHNPPEERQDWGAYVSPPSYTGQPNSYADARQQQLCARVQEMLPSLLENDGEIRPEMAASIYAHLAVCIQCAQDFAEMQRIVSMVEALAPPEMPIDFSVVIMQRIQVEFGPARSDIPIRPLRAVSSDVSGEAAVKAGSENRQETPPQATAHTINTAVHTEEKQVASSELELKQTATTQTTLSLWQRLTGVGVLLAVVGFFLLTSWGREALGVNAMEAMNWLGGIGKAVRDIPLLGSIVALVGSVLTQVGDTLAQTYRTLGATTPLGLTIDLGICAVGYYILVARRQRQQLQGF